MPRRPRPPKTCRNPRCPRPGRLFVPPDGKPHPYCGRACSAQDRPRGFYQAIGRKGGTTRALHLLPGVVQAQARAVVTQGMTPLEAFKAGARWQRRRAHNTDYSRAFRVGFSQGYEQGYEQALRDTAAAARLEAAS